jgi:hypothetical protein
MFSDNRFAMTVNFVIGAGRVYGNPSSVDSYLTGSWKGSEYYVNKTDLVPINNILLSQGKTFKLSQVQLEPGIASTQFEVQPPKEELESCQRYFCSTSPIKTVAVDPTAYILGNNGLRIFSPSGSTAAPFDEYPTATWQFPVTMRTYPKLRSFNSRMNTLSSGIWLSATDIINSTSTNVSKALYCADTTPEPNGDPSSIYGSDVTLSPPRLSYNVENFTVAIEYNDGPAATYYTDLCADAEEYF